MNPWLATYEASYTSGSFFVVDGGQAGAGGSACWEALRQAGRQWAEPRVRRRCRYTLAAELPGGWLL